MKKGENINGWTLHSSLGEGGNGAVWKCSNPQNQFFAIKILKEVKEKGYKRFRDEVNVIKSHPEIIQLLPIVDDNLPQDFNGVVDGNSLYYVMPLAESGKSKLLSLVLPEKIAALQEIIELTSILHSKSIAHRDIKPDNILYYKNHYVLTDFGLVFFVDKERVTKSTERVGAKRTLAPEMEREGADQADPYKADVYSLAKTIWIVLTGIEDGFEGQYSNQSSIGLTSLLKGAISDSEPIHDLLQRATEHNPALRPSITEFLSEYISWGHNRTDFVQTRRALWKSMHDLMFPMPNIQPKRTIWTDKDDIMQVLQYTFLHSNQNHLFFPDGGGLDLSGVAPAYETDCIELHFDGLVYIVKPKRLLYETFGSSTHWNYFRLELDEMKPWDDRTSADAYDEGVTELSPGTYAPYEIMEDTDFYADMYPITKESRQIARFLRGSMVIFCKGSYYNLNTSTYDARHEKNFNTDTFRQYIERNSMKLPD